MAGNYVLAGPPAEDHDMVDGKDWRDGEWIIQESLSSNSESVILRDENVSPGKHCYVVRAESDSTFTDLPVVGYSSPIWLNIQ